jgi:hypothetical protein
LRQLVANHDVVCYAGVEMRVGPWIPDGKFDQDDLDPAGLTRDGARRFGQIFATRNARLNVCWFKVPGILASSRSRRLTNESRKSLRALRALR